MNSIRLLKIIGVLVLLTAATGRAERERPNILLFLVDDMGVMDTSVPFLVDADAGQLRQVLTNLMSNSAEAMQQQGQITVEAQRDDGFDVVTLTDDGPGIPESLRARVFEPLVTTKVKGTGLGLPICLQIVERHGGSIEVVGGGKQGAVLRLRLPSRATS